MAMEHTDEEVECVAERYRQLSEKLDPETGRRRT